MTVNGINRGTMGVHKVSVLRLIRGLANGRRPTVGTEPVSQWV